MRLKPIPSLTVAALTSMWIATLGNWALWDEIFEKLSGYGNLQGLGLALGFGVFIAGATFALLALFAWGRWIKLACAVALVAAAAGAHFMLSYRVVIDTSMMVNVLQTNPREVGDLLNLQFVLTVLGLAVLPCAWLWWQPVRRLPVLRQTWHNTLAFVLALLLAVLALWPVFQSFSSLMRNHKHVRYLINPLNSVVALADMAVGRAERDATQLPIGEDARIGQRWTNAAKPPLLLLVVGETARADHFGLNGYSRNTTLQLQALGDEVTSFSNVRSCGTNTAVSLPCMFSHLGRLAWNERESEYQNLLHVLHRAGYAVLWLDNQSGCKGVCNGLPTVNTAALKLPEHCASGECHDAVMLAVLDAEVAKLDPVRRAKGVVVAMHQMGSHGPAYFKRVPQQFAKFTPECRTSNLQDCSREHIVNSYDNTILYTDALLASSIAWLKGKATSHAGALLYVSDHGESLGENNLYLHGLPYAIAPDTQKHVPMVTWFSDAFAASAAAPKACVQGQRNAVLTHDNLFHTVAGMLDVQMREYKPALDAFATCRK